MDNIFSSPALAETSGETFLPTLVVIALAFFVPLLVSRINKRVAIPVVVGEIFLGILIGQLFPELKDDNLLDLLSEIGFGYLFFLAGMEIDFANLRPRAKASQTAIQRILTPVNLGVLTYVGTLALGGLLAYFVAQTGILPPSSWLFVAIAVAPSSLGIIVTVLKETLYVRTELGQKLLVAATVADFATVLILTVAVSVLANGGFSADVALIGLIFVAFAVLYYIGRYLYNRQDIQKGLSKIDTATTPIKLRFAFLAFMAFMALSVAINAKIVLGTFMAGVLIKLLAKNEDHDVIHQLEGIGFSFFVPIFFIMIGVEFNVQALIESWQEALILLPILIVIATLVKVVPALLFRFIHSWRDSLAGGMLLTARLSLLVAVAKQGVDLGIFDPATEAALILLAMFMATVGPLVFIRFMPKAEVAVAPPIVVSNATEMGLELAKQLTSHGEQVILIDPDEAHVARAKEQGFTIIHGHVDRPDDNVAPILENAQRFVSTYSETDINYRICKFVIEQYDVPHVVAEVVNPQDLPKFEDLGVKAMNTTLDRMALLTLLTRVPTSYDLMTRTDDDQEIHEVRVRNHQIIGKSLREIRLSQGLSIMAVRRHGELIVPNGDTRLAQDDYVTVVGKVESGPEIFQMFSTYGSLGVGDILHDSPNV